MKKLILTGLILFSALSVFAVVNPQIRACHSVNGEFFVLKSDYDELGICKFGPALVGAIDILNKDDSIEEPLSLIRYKQGLQSCSVENVANLTSFEGDVRAFCIYSDNSLIDLETVKSGKNNPRNSKLNSALGL